MELLMILLGTPPPSPLAPPSPSPAADVVPWVAKLPALRPGQALRPLEEMVDWQVRRAVVLPKYKMLNLL